MDYKQLRRQLCQLTGRSQADIDALTEGLALIIRESCADMDAVAIPTFGTFQPVKHLEEEITDLSTGKKMLVPPEIILEFHPAAVLQKRMKNE